MDTDKKEQIKKLPKTFMSPAYVEEAEKGHYTMWRDILVETDQPDGVGGFYREKMGKRIGPMMVLRQARQGEPVDFMTSTPGGEVVGLTRIFPPREHEQK